MFHLCHAYGPKNVLISAHPFLTMMTIYFCCLLFSMTFCTITDSIHQLTTSVSIMSYVNLLLVVIQSKFTLSFQ
uniref:Uncharacterized protein n=1 Tax=Arundo donax TaxID=35708 RepID=A0A0A9CEU4_ARUDO